MARHGENIRKRKDGRWEGRYLAYSEEKGKKVYRSVYGRSYEEAREKLGTQRNHYGRPKPRTPREFQASGTPVPGQVAFTAVAEEWLREVKASRKQSTYVKYCLAYHNHLEEPFQNVVLPEITDALVREKLFQPDSAIGSLSGSAQRSIRCVLNQVLKYASRRYSTAIPDLSGFTLDARKRRVEALTKKEQASLFPVLLQGRDDPFRMAVLLCLYTGLRLGELCVLRWEDIDLPNRLVVVSRTVQRVAVSGGGTKTALLETEPKSEFSKREIPLPGGIAMLIARFQNGQEYVFGGNKPLEPRTLQYRFKKILREAGLPDKNFHILRHTFATNCVEGGADVKSLSEILGHSDVKITLNRYVHPSMDIKRKHLDILSEFYGQIHGQTV